MSFNFNGVNKNKVYMNGVEVTKAYMNGVQFYTSGAVYKLNFDASNQDGISLPSDVSLTNNGDYIHIVGKTPFNSPNLPFVFTDNAGQDQLRILSNGQIRFGNTGSGGNLFSPSNLLTDDTFNVKLEIFNNSTQWQITTNGVVDIRTLAGTGISFKDFFYKLIPTDFELEYLEYKAQGVLESFPFTEGSGNTITGDNSTIGTITTSNAAGIAYIDANVWEEII